MARLRTPLTIALVCTTLLLLGFIAATALSFPIWIRYRNVAFVSTLRTATQITAGLTALGLLVAAAIIACATALQPAGRWRKLLYIAPAYFLGFTLIGVLLYVLRIGTVGPFTTIWLAIGGLLSTIGIVAATLRMPLGERIAKAVVTTLTFTALPSVLTWMGMVLTIVTLLLSQPSATTGGAAGASGGQNAAPTAPAATTPAQGEGQPEGPPGQSGPGGRATTTPLLIGTALMSLFGVFAWASTARAIRESRATSAPRAASQIATLDYKREIGQVAFSTIAITVVGLAVAQLIPVSRDNPPAQTTVQWDSPQTEQLARRACMDCHSNETTWPWYAYAAPGSWLLRSHVSDGREEMNLSELNAIQAQRRSRLPEQAAQQIRSGAMPPSDYLIMHPEARLSDAEKQQLLQGMQQSLKTSLGQ